MGNSRSSAVGSNGTHPRIQIGLAATALLLLLLSVSPVCFAGGCALVWQAGIHGDILLLELNRFPERHLVFPVAWLPIGKYVSSKTGRPASRRFTAALFPVLPDGQPRSEHLRFFESERLCQASLCLGGRVLAACGAVCTSARSGGPGTSAALWTSGSALAGTSGPPPRREGDLSPAPPSCPRNRGWPNAQGATALVLDPLDFLRRLAALVSFPRSHSVRRHGVFANRNRPCPRQGVPPVPATATVVAIPGGRGAVARDGDGDIGRRGAGGGDSQRLRTNARISVLLGFVRVASSKNPRSLYSPRLGRVMRFFPATNGTVSPPAARRLATSLRWS